MRKQCVVCPDEFDAKRASARYCSERCRKRAQRQPQDAPVRPAGAVGGLLAATEAKLAAAGRLEGPEGQAALVLARRIDGSEAETGSGLAALVRQLHATLAEALKGVSSRPRKTDELKARRDRKLAAG